MLENLPNHAMLSASEFDLERFCESQFKVINHFTPVLLVYFETRETNDLFILKESSHMKVELA